MELQIRGDANIKAGVIEGFWQAVGLVGAAEPGRI
jgi:hypothetical protein